MNLLELKCRLTGVASEDVGNLGKVSVYNHGDFPPDFVVGTCRQTAKIVAQIGYFLPIERVEYGIDLYSPKRTAWSLRNGRMHSEGSGDTRNRRIGVLLFSTGDDFDDVHIDEVRGSVSHEVHHLGRYSVAEPKTLGEHLVAEGLAMHFANEVGGKRGLPSKYAVVTSSDRLGELKERALRGRGDASKDVYLRWFCWGDGHVLGFEIVGNFLQKNPGAKASSSYAEPAESFFDF